LNYDGDMADHEMRPPTLLALPIYLAGNVARIGISLLSDALAERDLRVPHFAVLTALSDFGPLAQYELADHLDGNRSHLVGYVDHLEDRGLVRRERDQDDRRRQRVALTPEGQAQLVDLHRAAEQASTQFLRALSDRERKTLTGLLRRVLEAEDHARLELDTPAELS
jgi:DNA-binding MarR family transcriptional regulator